MTCISAPLETGWRRDKWVVVDGPMQAHGSRRVCVIHKWLARYRCRVTAVVPKNRPLGSAEWEMAM